MPEDRKDIMAEAEKNTILIIDDDDTLLTTYTMSFESKGYKVVIARDGAEGLTQAKKTRPDLIMVDLMMPNVGGKDFLEHIKNDEELKDIPVMVCTALIEDIEKNELMSLGAVDYMVKTEITPESLIAKARKHLKERIVEKDSEDK